MMFFNSINKFELYLTHKRENISFKFVLAKNIANTVNKAGRLNMLNGYRQAQTNKI